MASSCAVATCKNYRKTSPGISFHTFPTDELRLKTWKHFCRRKDTINVKTSRICSAHFTKESFDRDLRNELLGLTPRNLLKRDAVPTIYCPGEIKESKREKRRLEKEAKELVNSLLLTSGNILYRLLFQNVKFKRKIALLSSVIAVCPLVCLSWQTMRDGMSLIQTMSQSVVNT